MENLVNFQNIFSAILSTLVAGIILKYFEQKWKILLIVCSFSAMVGFIISHIFFSPSIPVPDVTGSFLVEGERIINEGGLVPDIIEEYDAYTDPDKIIRQKPKGGTLVKRDSIVKIFVCKENPPTVVVPDVTGSFLVEGERIIKEGGLIPDIIEEYDAYTDPHKIIRQKPKGGTLVKRGSIVEIVVCNSSSSDKPPIQKGHIIPAVIAAAKIEENKDPVSIRIVDGEIHVRNISGTSIAIRIAFDNVDPFGNVDSEKSKLKPYVMPGVVITSEIQGNSSVQIWVWDKSKKLIFETNIKLPQQKKEYKSCWTFQHPQEHVGEVWIRLIPKPENRKEEHEYIVRWGSWEKNEPSSFKNRDRVSLIHHKSDNKNHTPPLYFNVSPPCNVSFGQGNSPDPSENQINIDRGWVQCDDTPRSLYRRTTGDGNTKEYEEGLAPNEVIVGDTFAFRFVDLSLFYRKCVAFMIWGSEEECVEVNFTLTSGAYTKYSCVENRENAEQLLQEQVSFLENVNDFCRNNPAAIQVIRIIRQEGNWLSVQK